MTTTKQRPDVSMIARSLIGRSRIVVARSASAPGVCRPASKTSMSPSSTGLPPKAAASAASYRRRLAALTASRSAKPSPTVRPCGREIPRRRSNASSPTICISSTVTRPFAAGSDVTTRLVTSGRAPFGSASDSTRPTSLPLSLDVELHQLRDGAAEIGVAGRRRIDELRFEVRSLHGHEIPGIGAAERAVHALALLQDGVGDFDRAAHRLAAHRIEGTEIDRDRRMRRDRAAFERDVVERQSAGEFAELCIDEQAADVILRQKRIDDALGHRLVAVGNIDQIGTAIGGDHDFRLVAVAADEPVAVLGVLAVARRSCSRRRDRSAACSARARDRARRSRAAGGRAVCRRIWSSPSSWSGSPSRSSRSRGRRWR